MKYIQIVIADHCIQTFEKQFVLRPTTDRTAIVETEVVLKKLNMLNSQIDDNPNLTTTLIKNKAQYIKTHNTENYTIKNNISKSNKSIKFDQFTVPLKNILQILITKRAKNAANASNCQPNNLINNMSKIF